MSIPFAKGSAFKIDNVSLITKINDECQRLLKTSFNSNEFPGPQPVAVEKKNFEEMSKKEYVICEKTDGERHILILINIDNKPMCFITNRNSEFFFLPFSFKKEVFEGTIFDGELIKNNNEEWNYIIHDCMCYNGQDYKIKNHILRYAAIIDFITLRYVVKSTDCFNIKTKIFYKYGPLISETWEHIVKTSENKIDGLIFTPVNEPIKFGRQWDLLKWKEPGNNTIDLLVKKIGKKINLYGVKKQVNYIYKTFTESDKNFSFVENFCVLNAIDCKLKEGVIIEFKYSIIDELFKPYRVRSDKSYPNSQITIDNTVKNITEAIQIKDFVFEF